MKTLKAYLEDIDLFDFLEKIIDVLLACVSSPFVYKQFSGLSRGSDIFWNMSVDLLFIILVVIIVNLLKKVARKLSRWAER